MVSYDNTLLNTSFTAAQYSLKLVSEFGFSIICQESKFTEKGGYSYNFSIIQAIPLPLNSIPSHSPPVPGIGIIPAFRNLASVTSNKVPGPPLMTQN